MPVSAAQRRVAFKGLLASSKPLLLPGAYDALSAHLVERAGFPATYLGSFAAAAGLQGLPDVGLITLTELTDAARRIVDATSLPVLADAEKGFYEDANIWRTVRAFEAAGTTGIHIEDNLGGKHTSRPAGLLDADRMANRIRAALDARDDPNFLIIARTDAAWIYGDLEEAVARLRRYVAAGADLVFAPKIPAADLKKVRSRIEAPVVVAADLYDAPDGSRPGSTLAEYADAGADVLLLWYSLVGAAAKGVADTLDALASGAEIEGLGDLVLDQRTFESFMGYAEYEARASRYA
ncbi:isocitrate lyase/PEP mutase family protein [Streptomyces thermoviolaceus]|uniref:Isocitrate lyase/PEP mutase family protein n=1 Tax=Streptomyces thermoviolaceus subsp. thermoviolaceus TaxID=66860 RepID=A0ABX0YWG7_STRTL|nr:isocitrate lyase/PEP mutase family protein [Streptomyces thermoviolaceus]MCM3266155.1 isocitrate lyase/PEP mutase family protein [Streptomyces thermoviolaceus]NJP16901.1 isocitrate lyase/PEP mutase family protein [Streptomyces thermoviolaceus subsp. thermoviolaceus]WTD46618.1 isocitrate lyase/PEP mutase family protein [Streptomyces thermoviolaceus]GGV77103.1 carboxyvinyl-carboxyphosphonate phosphorylmutase [Streptomyces thermoviolaceus subsp. apingens]GHB03124.1 carboxyvinyl-carboxyphosphon